MHCKTLIDPPPKKRKNIDVVDVSSIHCNRCTHHDKRIFEQCLCHNCAGKLVSVTLKKQRSSFTRFLLLKTSSKSTPRTHIVKRTRHLLHHNRYNLRPPLLDGRNRDCSTQRSTIVKTRVSISESRETMVFREGGISGWMKLG